MVGVSSKAVVIAPILLRRSNMFARNRLQRHYSNTARLSGILHHEWIVEGKVVSNTEIDKRRTVLFLHGLLGNGKNLRSPAKRLTLAHPSLSALVIDLRGHGLSHQPHTANTTQRPSTPASPHTIQNCAQDIIETVQALNLTGTDHSPIGVVGHSLGGRCALQYTHQLLKQQQRQPDGTSTTATSTTVCSPKHTWLLDTVPGEAHGSVAQVVNAISSVPMPVKNKKELVRILTQEKGLDLAIASWMTTNLKKSQSDVGFEFIFDLDVAQSILDDFPNQDFCGMVQDCLVAAQGGNKIHLVMAGKNSAWTEDIIAQLQQMNSTMADHSRLEMVSLPKAGHWVHIDDLEGLMNVLERGFE